MRILAIHTIQKLCTLFVALVCFALLLCVSYGAKAAPAAGPELEQVTDSNDEPTFVLTAGEVSSGESEAVLQFKKSLLLPLFQTLLTELYTSQQKSVILRYEHPFSDSDCGKHSSLSKGP